MINFKQFIIEEKDQKDVIREIHHLPLHGSHEGVADTANALEDVHDTLVGKKSFIPKKIEFKGIPITFGIYKKRFFINHQGSVLYNFNDIDNSVKNDKTNLALKNAMTYIPSVLPRNSKFFTGNIIPSDQSTQLSIETDHKGKPVKDEDLTKFKSNKNMQVIDNSVQTNPTNYTPEEQNAFFLHMNNARKAYSKMDPEAFEAVAGHENKIKKYLKFKNEMNEKHSVEDFVNELMKEAQGKSLRKRKNEDSDQSADNVLKNHEKTVNHILQNEKAFKSVLDMTRSLGESSKILSNVLMKNGNQGDVILYHSDGRKSKLPISKPMNEEVSTTSIVTASSGDIRGMGYVSGNPGGNSLGYRSVNVVDSDQRNNLLFKLIKGFHSKHHIKR
mgnify:CR=1 FL=1